MARVISCGGRAENGRGCVSGWLVYEIDALVDAGSRCSLQTLVFFLYFKRSNVAWLKGSRCYKHLLLRYTLLSPDSRARWQHRAHRLHPGHRPSPQLSHHRDKNAARTFFLVLLRVLLGTYWTSLLRELAVTSRRPNFELWRGGNCLPEPLLATYRSTGKILES